MTSLMDRYLPRVQVKAAGLESLRHLDAPLLLAANHASRLDMGFVLRAAPAHVLASPLPAAAALRLHRSPVVFPEHGISPDGRLGHFHADVLQPALARRCPVVPVAIRGSLGLDAEPSRWQSTATPSVYVRFGAPLQQPSPDDVRDAIAALLREDETTWWTALVATADSADQSGHPVGAGEPATGWLGAWQGLAAAERPGESRRRTIWR